MARSTTKEPQATEREILDLLERKHAKTGNGGSGEYGFLTHVRNDAGFNANRTFDAVSIALWPSRGFEIHVYEVKVSRSDWLRELKDPKKSDDAWKIGNRFSIVATAGIVDLEELPAGWGLIEAHGAKVEIPAGGPGRIVGRKLRTVRATEYHGDKDPIPRGLMVSMLRAAGAVPPEQTVAEQAINDAEFRGYQRAADEWKPRLETAHQATRDLGEHLTLFANITGRYLHPTSTTREDVEKLARQVKEYLSSGQQVDSNRARLARLRDEMTQSAARIDRLLEDVTL